MKLVLTLEEVGNIVVEHLREKGTLKNELTDLNWHVRKDSLSDSYVEIKQ